MSATTKKFMELEKVQKEEFPEYKYKNITDLKNEYILSGDIITAALIDSFMVSSDAYLPYTLPEGTYGSLDGYQCAGIRYGVEPHEYISLPQIKIK